MPKFEKGKSGNPGGRPKDLQGIKALCQTQAPKVIEAVVKILENPESKDSDILKAGDMILDRAYGKPLQEVKGVQFNQYTQVWTKATKRAENITDDGKVHFRSKEESQTKPGSV